MSGGRLSRLLGRGRAAGPGPAPVSASVSTPVSGAGHDRPGPVPVAHAGWCGKIPAAGDFVGRGLPQEERDRLERFLAAVVTDMAARDGFGPAWQVMPIWRFAARPGALCSALAVGVILPSVDAVGRRFPLCLALLGAPGADADPDALLISAAPALATLERAGLALLGHAPAEHAAPPAHLPAPNPNLAQGAAMAMETGGGEIGAPASLRFPGRWNAAEAGAAMLAAAAAVLEAQASAPPPPPEATAPQAAEPAATEPPATEPDAAETPAGETAAAQTAATVEPGPVEDAPVAKALPPAGEPPLFAEPAAQEASAQEAPLFAAPAPEAPPLFPQAPTTPAPAFAEADDLFARGPAADLPDPLAAPDEPPLFHRGADPASDPHETSDPDASPTAERGPRA